MRHDASLLRDQIEFTYEGAPATGGGGAVLSIAHSGTNAGLSASQAIPQGNAKCERIAALQRRFTVAHLEREASATLAQETQYRLACSRIDALELQRKQRELHNAQLHSPTTAGS